MEAGKMKTMRKHEIIQIKEKYLCAEGIQIVETKNWLHMTLTIQPPF